MTRLSDPMSSEYDEGPVAQSGQAVRRSLDGKFVCPFCGSVNANTEEPCPKCGMENTPATRNSTRARSRSVMKGTQPSVTKKNVMAQPSALPIHDRYHPLAATATGSHRRLGRRPVGNSRSTSGGMTITAAVRRLPSRWSWSKVNSRR